jgi:predicted Zn-dependent protease
MKKTFKYLSCIVLGMSLWVLTGCQTTPVTGRKQLNLVSSAESKEMGLAEFDRMKKEMPIDTDSANNAMLQKVGKRIAAVADKDMPNAQWEFVLFKSEEANAFCLPGGKVGVYSGILPITKDEGGLATVIGHEVGHATANHGSERMSQMMVAQTGQQLLGSALGNTSQMTQQLMAVAYGAGTQVGVLLPFSRKQESEADHIGLIYMARAGFDPKQAVGFWTRFDEYNQKAGGAQGFAFLRSHPVDYVRIEQIKKWLPEAEAVYNQSITK